LEAWTASSGSNSANINWLVTDQLGTPRMIIDQTGALAGVKRHDYLPFGEELFAGTGGRIPSQGYSGDSVRQKFTSKERDNETGLDYFGARYYASAQGRFTSSDPLLASGTVYDPQSWNRYSYASNNPLRFVDPTGMWDWDASSGGSYTDAQLEARRHDRSLRKSERNAAKNALKFRERFRNAMSGGEDAVSNSNLTADQKTQVLAAMNSYGTENDSNGVTVGVAGHLGTGTGAGTVLNNDGTISVTFLSGHKGNDLIIDMAHEGQHVGDADAFLASGAKANDATDLTHRDREIRGYTISSLTAQALGVSSAIKGFEGRDQIWNSGWKKADQATIDSRRIERVERFVGTPRVGYPANAPGDRYSQEFHPRP
jgi:RHS repeat-associated protein